MKKIDENDIKKALNLYIDGWKIKDILRETNISHPTLLRKVKEAGIELREIKNKYNRYNEAEYIQAMELYRQGHSLQEVARITNIPFTNLHRASKRLGITIVNRNIQEEYEEDIRIRIGRRIKELRKDMNLTILQLYKLSGVHHSCLSAIEKGTYNTRMYIDVLAKLENVFDKKIDFV